jgi:hypothetical protein
MNGRIYDPALGRFMTADPHIDSPYNLQSLNRYSYVNNNPLGYTDPSGHFKLKKLFKIAAAIAVAWFAPEFIAAHYAAATTAAVSAARNSRRHTPSQKTIGVYPGLKG